MVKCWSGLIVLSLALPLSGCGTVSAVKGLRFRDGPGSDLNPAAVQNYAQTQNAIFSALDLAVTGGETGLPVEQYDRVVAGFNFVDSQCDFYLHELFLLDQTHEQFSSGINATQTLVNAILNTIPASHATLAIVAASFGFAGSFNNLESDRFLFGQQSKSIYKMVHTLQATYRAAAAIKDRDDAIKSNGDVMNLIKGYLRLCTPEAIQANIAAAIDVAQGASRPLTAAGKPELVDPSANVAVELVPGVAQ